MKQNKRLALRREAMTELRADELTTLAGGGPPPESVALCKFSEVSCSVCSVNCGDTFTCPSDRALEVIRTALPPTS